MNELKFKRNFVSTFLATWAFSEYAKARANNDWDVFDDYPVEDAEELAQMAWDQRVEREARVKNYG